MPRFVIAFALAVATCGTAVAQPRHAQPFGTHLPKYFITLRKSTGKEVDKPWAAKTCVYLHNVLTMAQQAPVETQCSAAEVTASGDPVERARASGEFDSRIDLVEGGDMGWVLTFDNWKPVDDTDFKQARHVLKATRGPLQQPISESDRQIAVQELVWRYVHFRDNTAALKEYMVALLSNSDSDRVKVEVRDGELHYVDRKTGQELDARQAYAAYVDEKPQHKHFARTMLEITSVLGLASIPYYARMSEEDAENKSFAIAFKRKFGGFDWWRFDDNDALYNVVAHPLAGAVYYQVARSNGYGMGASLLFSIVGSAMNEFGMEAREIMSVNDMVLTPGMGFVLGETFKKFADFLDRAKPSKAREALRLALNPFDAVNRWLDHRPQHEEAAELDKLGFPADVWHSIEIGLGTQTRLDRNGKRVVDGAVNIEAEVIDIPGWGKQGQIEQWMHNAPEVYARLEVEAGPEGLAYFRYFNRLMYAAWAKQNLVETASGDLRGYNVLIGPAASMRVAGGDTRQRRNDIHGEVGVLGGAIEASFYLPKGVLVRVSTQVMGELAQVKSVAIQKYAESIGAGESGVGTVEMHEFEIEGAKASVKRFGNYYAYGISTNDRLTVSKGRWEVGGDFEWISFDSIEGLDLAQDAGRDRAPMPLVTDDFNLKDTRARQEFWLSYTPVKDRLKLTLGYRDVDYWGRVKSTEVEKKQAGLFGRVSILF